MAPSRRALVLIAVAVFAVSCVFIIRGRSTVDETTATVGPAASRVAFSGGWIELPAGAVPKETTLHVRQAPGMPSSAPVTKLTRQLGSGVSIDLSGAQPAKPLRLGLRVESLPPGVTQDLLAVATAPQGGVPRLVPARYDGASRTLIADLDHLSDVWPAAVDLVNAAGYVKDFTIQSLKLRAAAPSGEDSFALGSGHGRISFAADEWNKGADPWLWGRMKAEGDAAFVISLTNNRPVGFTVAIPEGAMIRSEPPDVGEYLTRLAYDVFDKLTLTGATQEAVLTPGSTVHITVPRKALGVIRDEGGAVKPHGPSRLAGLYAHPTLFFTLVFQAAILDLAAILTFGQATPAVSQKVVGALIKDMEVIGCIGANVAAAAEGPPALSQLATGRQVGFRCLGVLLRWDVLSKVLGTAGSLAAGKLLSIVELLAKNIAAFSSGAEIIQRMLTQSAAFVVSVQRDEEKVDWRDRQYFLTDDKVLVDIENGRGIRPDLEAAVLGVSEGSLPDLGEVAAVLFGIHPVPSNFVIHELRVFGKNGSFVGRIPSFKGQMLDPVYLPETVVFSEGKLVADVKFYGPQDSHASGPSIVRTVTWQWNGSAFVAVSGV